MGKFKSYIRKTTDAMTTAAKLSKITARFSYYLLRIRFVEKKKAHDLLQRAMQKTLKDLNINITTVGTPAYNQGKPVYFMPNHISYVDALIMMAKIENPFFVSSKSARKWPIIGKMSSKLNFAYVDQIRKRVSNQEKAKIVKDTAAELKTYALKGHNLVLFPEGKLSDGTDLLRFKPGTFQMFFDAAGKPDDRIIAQPIAIEVTKVNGQAIPRGKPSKLRDIFARYNYDANGKKGPHNKKLLRHIWDLAANSKKGRIDVTLHFLDTLSPIHHNDNHDMAKVARNNIRKVIKP